jgi:hypothetical protein
VSESDRRTARVMAPVTLGSDAGPPVTRLCVTHGPAQVTAAGRAHDADVMAIADAHKSKKGQTVCGAYMLCMILLDYYRND